jgi:chromate transport protein ChrA
VDLDPKPTFIRDWSFAGIIIVAAVAGYFSKDAREPAIASATLVVLFLIVVGLHTDAVTPAFVFFSLSLGGAWLGARAQQLRNKQSPH